MLSLFGYPVFRLFYKMYSGHLNSKHLNSELIWIANFYLFGIQMVAKWMVWTIRLSTMVKRLVSYQTLYHSNSKILVCYSRHGLNNGPSSKQTVLEHLNTKLVGYSDPHCDEQKIKPWNHRLILWHRHLHHHLCLFWQQVCDRQQYCLHDLW